ncbi:hypothetical protein JQ596_29745 [Bradyrhizobium manausense]|uniref:hypothetical protein n=1 Tax=Bradyrhizobium TaxID=374 RepID=UPI001BAABC97|nr:MULTISPECIES: hypothetical protein [Bradyrhizobium]MBR0829723.1 hypothetical protein [Bradyrhizobium manausense]UVO25336.1 hypothetical protein KUF59_22280 [Bradyrhizobium arachidis]
MAKRSRKKQSLSFDERLQRAADEAREAARKLPIGRERDALLKKAKQTETAARINLWLTSAGLQSPK